MVATISKWRDPISALTHLIGFIFSIPCVVILISKSFLYGSPIKIFSLFIFGISLIMLYGASTMYHMATKNQSTIKKLKKFDHIMIFGLIAGTYTPVCLVTMKNESGLTLFIVVWAISICGMLIEAFGKSLPRFISTSLYVILGWVIIFAFVPLARSVELSGIMLLLYGGISYTVGAVIYGIKKPVINPIWFGSHELFHIFVMLGSLFHIIFMFLYI